MEQEYLSRIAAAVTTGVPGATPRTQPAAGHTAGSGPSFQEVLGRRLEQQSAIQFSKHAAQRVAQRGLDVSESSLRRLNEGVRIAGEKGLDDTLILVDKTAFIVSVKNNKVITTVGGNELAGNVFTNIEGTVIV